jgi:type I restriction enzyme S subunit
MSSTESKPLPKGWEECSFGDIAFIRNGYAFKSNLFKKSKEYESDVPLIRQSQMKGSRIDISDAVFLPAEYLKKHPDYIIAKGDVIIGMSGSIGKVCLYGEDIPALQNQRTGKIIPYLVSELNPKFFGLFLSNIERELTKYAKGMGVQNISSKDIEQLPFNLPPRNEQYRIVAKIEELFSELDKGIESLKTAQSQLKVYRQALLKHAFEGKLTAQWRAENQDKLETADAVLKRIQHERTQLYQQQITEWEAAGKQGSKPKVTKPLPPFSAEELVELPELSRGWVWIKYGDICSIVRNGISEKPVGNSGMPIFRISAVRPMFFDMSDIRYIDNSTGKFDAYCLKRGDLVFTRYNGSRHYVGVCAEYKSDERRLFPDKLVQTRVSSNDLLSSYFEKALNSGASRKFLESKIRTTAGQSGVSGDDIKNVPVPICSTGEQSEIVNLLESKLSEIDQLDQTITKSLQQAEALRQSILKKAFSGQLVPQDPNDEPASVLLARIKEANSQLPKNKKGNK